MGPLRDKEGHLPPKLGRGLSFKKTWRDGGNKSEIQELGLIIAMVVEAVPFPKLSMVTDNCRITIHNKESTRSQNLDTAGFILLEAAAQD